MTSRTALLVVFCIVASAPRPVQAQETLGEEDVKQSLQNAQFQKSLGGCFKKTDRPDEITLVLYVKAMGQTQLVSVEPELLPAATACVSKAVAYLSMPATGSHFQITVTVPVPESGSSLSIKQVDVPPHSPPSPSPPLVAPAAVPLVAAPAYPLVAHPGAVKAAPPPGPTPQWKFRYSAGKKRLIGGAVALGVGLQFALVGGLGFLGTLPLMCDGSRYTNDEYFCQMWTGVGISLLVLGAAGIVTGAVLVTQGKRIKQEALGSKPQISIAPLPAGKGIVAGLTWRF